MIQKVVVFIDAFAFEYLPLTAFMENFGQKARLVPGLGYSINVKAELFSGLKPKDVEFFCMWSYSTSSRFEDWHRYLKLMKPSRISYITDRVAHKVLSRLFGIDLFNIPFEYLHLFHPSHAFNAYDERFGYKSIVNGKNGLAKALHTNFPLSKIRDRQVFELACRLIDNQDYSAIFVAFSDLDWITHRNGTDSDQVKKKVLELDGFLERIYLKMRRFNTAAEMMVISDHGMSDVRIRPLIEMEKIFGPVGRDRYVYFTDSTFIRIWIFDSALDNPIQEYVSASVPGKFLDWEERRKYGVDTDVAGHLLFVCDEGVTPLPSFAGGKRAKALHGYMPECLNQHGVLLTDFHLQKRMITAMEAHQIISDFLDFNKT